MKSLFIAVLSCAPLAIAFSQIPAEAMLTTHMREIAKNPNSSWAHYSLAELLLQRKNYSEALNEFRAALRGDKQPAWVQVWSHIHLGKIFAATGQRERAIQQFQQALATEDNTRGALDEAGSLLKTQLAQPGAMFPLRRSPSGNRSLCAIYRNGRKPSSVQRRSIRWSPCIPPRASLPDWKGPFACER